LNISSCFSVVNGYSAVKLRNCSDEHLIDGVLLLFSLRLFTLVVSSASTERNHSDESDDVECHVLILHDDLVGLELLGEVLEFKGEDMWYAGTAESRFEVCCVVSTASSFVSNVRIAAETF